MNAGSLVSAAAQGVVASVVRTFVPQLAALAITALGLIHITVDSTTAQTAVNAATVAVIAYIWHIVGLVAEKVGSSKLGWFFHGFAAAPAYTAGNPWVANAVRTFVPYAAGAIAVWLTRISVHLDNATAEQLITGLISGAITMAWYLAGRLGETFWSSKWGILLGFLKPPAYTVAAVPAKAAVQWSARSGGYVDVSTSSSATEVAVIGGRGRHAAAE